MSAEAPKQIGTEPKSSQTGSFLPRILRKLIGVQSEPQPTPLSLGFIERLRQQKAVEYATEQEIHSIAAAKERAEEATRQQREAQEREFHRQKRLQAETYLQECGIEHLIAELGKILGNTGDMGTRGWGRLDSGRLDSDWFTGYNKVPDLATDPDSTSIGFLRDVKKIGNYVGDVRERSHHGSRETWDIFEGKYFAVENRPDGIVIFHARRDITVPEPKWRNNIHILEDALEQAYNNPRIQKFNGHTMEYYPDIGD